eukprot:Nk52_evm8s156 gene=Nk52_evmTU8s156
MTTRAERDAKKRLNEQHSQILQGMLKEEENRVCCDCLTKGPRWASWNLGCFICIRCAGIHRNLGVHISKVKSVNLDQWNPDQVENMTRWGNKKVNELYEYDLPASFRRPTSDASVEQFIRAKYESKRYMDRSRDGGGDGGRYQGGYSERLNRSPPPRERHHRHHDERYDDRHGGRSAGAERRRSRSHERAARFHYRRGDEREESSTQRHQRYYDEERRPHHHHHHHHQQPQRRGSGDRKHGNLVDFGGSDSAFPAPPGGQNRQPANDQEDFFAPREATGSSHKAEDDFFSAQFSEKQKDFFSDTPASGNAGSEKSSNNDLNSIDPSFFSGGQPSGAKASTNKNDILKLYGQAAPNPPVNMGQVPATGGFQQGGEAQGHEGHSDLLGLSFQDNSSGIQQQHQGMAMNPGMQMTGGMPSNMQQHQGMHGQFPMQQGTNMPQQQQQQQQAFPGMGMQGGMPGMGALSDFSQNVPSPNAGPSYNQNAFAGLDAGMLKSGGMSGSAMGAPKPSQQQLQAQSNSGQRNNNSCNSNNDLLGDFM